MALTDAVLLNLLQCMREMRMLSVNLMTRLTTGVVPAIGALCRVLEQLKLPVALNIDSFDDYAEQTPTLPNLTSLAMSAPANVVAHSA
jgi:hypothetical protein